MTATVMQFRPRTPEPGPDPAPDLTAEYAAHLVAANVPSAMVARWALSRPSLRDLAAAMGRLESGATAAGVMEHARDERKQALRVLPGGAS